MRLWFILLCVISAFAADLRNEDLTSLRTAFQKAGPSLRLWASDKKPIDSNRSVMVVSAGPERKLSDTAGVFVVSGPSNRVVQMVDKFPLNESEGSPQIGRVDASSIVVHFLSDYGLYYGSVKYFYSQGPVRKFRYRMIALETAAVRDGGITYQGVAGEQGYEVTMTPRGDETPAYTVRQIRVGAGEPTAPVSFSLADGGTAMVTNTPVGQSHRPSGFTVKERAGKQEFFGAPVPTMELHRKLRASEQAPVEIENDVGPAAQEGSVIWYANKFYDGEGVSGVGAVGEFDVRTRKYRMHYLPEMAGWSGSALRIDRDDLWIGLMRQPEGAAYGGGLLRYNRTTGAVVEFDVPDYINTIDRLGDAIYCGTSDGLYVIRGKTITHMAFEPDVAGRLTAVVR